MSYIASLICLKCKKEYKVECEKCDGSDINCPECNSKEGVITAINKRHEEEKG